MPSLKSARVSLTKRSRNRKIRSASRTRVATALRAISEKDSDRSRDLVKKAVQGLDKAAKTGTIHSNHAARSKSRLMRKLNSLLIEE